MLSRSPIGWPQAGQALRGRTTDFPAGTRTMTTLRNEPMITPSRPTTTISTAWPGPLRSTGTPPVTLTTRRPYRSPPRFPPPSVVGHLRGVTDQCRSEVRRGVPLLPAAAVAGGGHDRGVGRRVGGVLRPGGQAPAVGVDDRVA